MVYIKEQFFKFGDQNTKMHYTKVVGLLGSFVDLFPLCINAFDICNQFLYPINTSDPNPVYSRSHLTSEQNQQLKSIVNQLTFTGHLKLSRSKWSSPVYPYTNEDGKLELFVDFKELNEITIDYTYHINQARDIVDYVAASNSVLFTKLVIRDPYYQLKVGEDTAHKTAIATDFGTFQFSTLCDGLKNANSCLQMTMEKVLSDSSLTNENMNSISVYLGEILVFSTTFQDHFNLLKDVLKSLRQSNLKLDAEKCYFFMNEINFLDHIINDTGVSVDQNKLTKILKTPEPNSKCELKSFLDSLRHFEAYIPDYSSIVEPLYDSLNSSPFFWEDFEESAFNCLKYKLALNCPF